MNLFFNDKQELLRDSILLKDLKYHLTVQKHYFTLIEFHNVMLKNPEEPKIFVFSPNEGMLKSIFSRNSRDNKNFHLNLSSCVIEGTPQEIKDFSNDTHYVSKDNKMQFLNNFIHAKAMKLFLEDFSSEIKNNTLIDETVRESEYKKYSNKELDYVQVKYNFEVKALYSKLTGIFKKYSNIKSVDINFESGVLLTENKITHISVYIKEFPPLQIKFELPITFYLSNMLNKSSHSLGDEENLKHVLKIENTKTGWLNFDNDILDSYQKEFKSIVFKQQLNKKLQDKQVSIRKIKI